MPDQQGQTITFSPTDIAGQAQTPDQQNNPAVPKPAPLPAKPVPVQGAAPVTFNPGDINSDATDQNKTAAASPAAQPGAYQTQKGGPIHNTNEDAHVFDSWTKENADKTGALGAAGKVMKGEGYLMQRPDESYQQFMARAIEAGKHVTQEQMDAETSISKKGAPVALGVAAAAGPTMLALEGGAAEALTQIGSVPGLLKGAWDWAVANPVKAYIAYQVIKDLVPKNAAKVLHLISKTEPVP